jgi:hypothetical protein
MSSTFVNKPSAEYRAAVAALRELPHDERGRAFAEATADEAKALWMEKEGVRESGSRDWRRLVCGRRKPLWDGLPGQDHADLFIKDRKPHVFTFQPYGLSWFTLVELVEACQHWRLEARIATWPAWHFPGEVLFVEITRARKA